MRSSCVERESVPVNSPVINHCFTETVNEQDQDDNITTSSMSGEDTDDDFEVDADVSISWCIYTVYPWPVFIPVCSKKAPDPHYSYGIHSRVVSVVSVYLILLTRS